MTTRVPLPAGVELSIWEKIYRNISVWFSEESQEKLWNFFQWADAFFQEFGVWLFAGALGVALFFLAFGFVKRRQRSIEKLWKLVLFFLAKRQMILPLIYTFGKRYDLLSHSELEEILEIRKLSQSIPFRKNPAKRMEIEIRVSHLLFEFFTKIENQANHPSKAITQKLAEDFEFIDEKLVKLQKLYNQEAQKWNRKRNRFPIIILAFLFRFPKFQFFGKNNS